MRACRHERSSGCGEASASSASAPGSSARTGATSTRTTRSTSCDGRRRARRRPSSTPPTSTATAAPSSFVRPLRPRHPSVVRGHQDGPPGRAGRRELHRRQLPGLERPVAGEPRRRHARPGAAALPAGRRCSTTTRCSTPWTRWCRRAASRAYGVSVETCAQALTAIARPARAPRVQIILNCFRLKPLDEVLPAAREAGVAIIARVPLASGTAVRPLRREHDVRRRTTTATSTATARPSTSARPSPASRTRSGWHGRAGAGGAGAGRRDAGAVRAALDHRPARRQQS